MSSAPRGFRDLATNPKGHRGHRDAFDWRASSGNQVTFPVGPTIGKVVKLGGVAPVKFELQGLYVPVYPAHDGERFIVQFQIIPVIPAPIAWPFFDSQ
jgi:hypothetical protein